MQKALLLSIGLIVIFFSSSFAIGVKPKIGKGNGCPFGFGICILIGHRASPHNLERNGNTLILSLDEKALQNDQPEVMVFFKGKSSGKFEVGLDLPPDIVKALGVNGTMTILPGTIPISYSKGVYTLIINCRVEHQDAGKK